MSLGVAGLGSELWLGLGGGWAWSWQVSPRSSVFSHLDLASTGSHAINTSNTIDPISTSPTNSNSHAAITDNAILTILNTCFCADIPYTWLGTSHLLAINDTSAQEYEECCYRDISLSLARVYVLQPHVYELAAQMYLLMRWQRELQALVIWWVAPHVLVISHWLTVGVGPTMGLQALVMHASSSSSFIPLQKRVQSVGPDQSAPLRQPTPILSHDSLLLLGDDEQPQLDPMKIVYSVCWNSLSLWYYFPLLLVWMCQVSIT